MHILMLATLLQWFNRKIFFNRFEKKNNKFFDIIQIIITISNKMYFYTIEKDI